MDTPTGQRLPIAEAASALGLSEKTIRRRIKVGTLRADRVVTPQGHVWLVEVATPRVDSPGQGVQVNRADRQLAMVELTRSVANEVTRSLSSRIEELTRENERLRRQLQAALEAPKEEPAARPMAPNADTAGWPAEAGETVTEPTQRAEATSDPAARPWWRRWFG